MRRRKFLGVVGGAAALSVARPNVVVAQQPMPLVGFLSAASPDGYAERLRGFRQGLKDAGFVEGENVTIEYRWAENQIDRLPAMVLDLVRRNAVAIAAIGGVPAVLAAKAATKTIPILFVAPDDPVKLGYVTSLARPGGNVTGVNFMGGELGTKRLELLRDLIPRTTRVAVLVNRANPATKAEVGDVQAAAPTMGLQVEVFSAGTSREIDTAYAALVRERPDALLVIADPLFNGRRIQLVHLASRHALPAIYWQREFAEAGGLISYGSNIGDAFHQLGVYAGRILKGAKPMDLPVVQSSKFELVINTQAARLLGLAVSPSLIARADEVIE